MLILMHGTNATNTDVFQSVESAGKAEVDLQDFWSMESIGIKDTGAKSDDDIAMETCKENIKFQDGRYCVTWPWKENI